MTPRIETLKEKKLIGKQLRMSLSNNRTGELWRSFMQNRRSITNNIGSELYSMQIYDPSYFRNFNPATEFQKWAAIEVVDHNTVPEGMETVTLPGGLYAVFFHKGDASTGPQVFQYIFGTWLPGSDYVLDNRPHFELLGEKYKNGDPASEEEFWIPVRPK
ncbi:GyrI-like domain-containing protein [Fulvivirgaceae bacterium PWU4]|uniref:GyrI-like domain-containing protein n=1 Tax=Chryseosolibacter histidini TaxID=2782349 RepID=A0AAP2DJQ3_9BACT|nr:GyrI-like domain-containing protein [Chryseosolibacter histidini]MBT1696628.1 GyrI-like domain-containing protein [Chryseosolibacter histidini]